MLSKSAPQGIQLALHSEWLTAFCSSIRAFFSPLKLPCIWASHLGRSGTSWIYTAARSAIIFLPKWYNLHVACIWTARLAVASDRSSLHHAVLVLKPPEQRISLAYLSLSNSIWTIEYVFVYHKCITRTTHAFQTKLCLYFALL